VAILGVGVGCRCHHALVQAADCEDGVLDGRLALADLQDNHPPESAIKVARQAGRCDVLEEVK